MKTVVSMAVVVFSTEMHTQIEMDGGMMRGSRNNVTSTRRKSVPRQMLRALTRCYREVPEIPPLMYVAAIAPRSQRWPSYYNLVKSAERRTTSQRVEEHVRERLHMFAVGTRTIILVLFSHRESRSNHAHLESPLRTLAKLLA